jgi:hypothetical protein
VSFSEKVCDAILRDLLDVMAATLLHGRRVTLANVCTIVPCVRRATARYHPGKMELSSVPRRCGVKMILAASLRKALRKKPVV